MQSCINLQMSMINLCNSDFLKCPFPLLDNKPNQTVCHLLNRMYRRTFSLFPAFNIFLIKHLLCVRYFAKWYGFKDKWWSDPIPLSTKIYINNLNNTDSRLNYMKLPFLGSKWWTMAISYGSVLGDTAVSSGLKWNLSFLPRNWTWVAWVKIRNPSC